MIKPLLSGLSLVLGGLIGWCLPWLDKIAYLYILHPEAQISQYFKYQLAQKNWRASWLLLKERGAEMDQLTSRGVLFQIAWLVLAVFVITSTTSLFGKVLVMALGVRILIEEWQEYWKNTGLLKHQLFWQGQREVSETELRIYLIAKSLVIVWLALLMF